MIPAPKCPDRVNRSSNIIVYFLTNVFEIFDSILNRVSINRNIITFYKRIEFLSAEMPREIIFHVVVISVVNIEACWDTLSHCFIEGRQVLNRDVAKVAGIHATSYIVPDGIWNNLVTNWHCKTNGGTTPPMSVRHYRNIFLSLERRVVHQRLYLFECRLIKQRLFSVKRCSIVLAIYLKHHGKRYGARLHKCFGEVSDTFFSYHLLQYLRTSGRNGGPKL